MVNCVGKDKDKNYCKNDCINGTKFCKIHQYMNDYTENMLNNLTFCKTCRKMRYFEGDMKTCEHCIKRINKLENNSLCLKDGCKFKRSNENIYCGKHQLCLFEDEAKLENKKLCFNYIRGCREKLDIDYKFSKCGNCLEYDREKDKKRRVNIKENNSNIDVTNAKTKYCTSCCKELSIDNFVGVLSTITKTCINCRENNKIQDAKRDKEHRNEIARKNEAKPENRAVKAKWKEDNYEKVAKTWMDSRERQIANLGTEEYLKKQAENAKNWRENNPEKTLLANDYKKNSRQLQYNVYSRNSEFKKLEFTISYDDYISIVGKVCYYCGTLQERGFNGIDRKDQTKGYILDNCVSCCKMCNYMKGSTSDEVFIKRVEHILTFQNKISGNLYPEYFASHKGTYYSEYKNRALKKQLDFLITIDDYNNITKSNCYLCGKSYNNVHKNGIDRIDNSKGYILDNVKCCCGECNYMKRDYQLDDIINRLLLIHNNHIRNVLIEEDYENSTLINTIQLTEHPLQNTFIPETLTKTENLNNTVQGNKHIVVNKNKKTVEEIRAANRLYKQKQREKLKEKYGDEDYKKMRAKEIAELRRKKAN